MLDGLRCAPLLHGWRGRTPVDVDKLADVVAAVSHHRGTPRHRRDRAQPGTCHRRRTARSRCARREPLQHNGVRKPAMIDLDISKEFAGRVALVTGGGQWLGKSAYTDSPPRG